MSMYLYSMAKGKGQRAFMRLPYEIVKSSNDESLFVGSDPSLSESGRFARSPAAFCFCRDIISVKFADISRPGTYEVTNRGLVFDVFIAGLPGEGKISKYH